MPDPKPLLGALGLCRKAGCLACGAQRVEEAIHAGKARLVLLTQDASPRTQNRVARACTTAPCQTIPFSAAQLAPLTPRPTAVYAVTDANLARLCVKHLAQLQTKEEAANGQ